MTYVVHPAAAIFPMMNDAELKKLAEDIKNNGLHQPIVLNFDESILVDGRNRLRACEIAGADTGEDYLVAEALPEMTEEQTIDYIVSANIHRRHLTAGQRAMLATELEPIYAEAARERMMAGKADPSANSRQGTSRDGRADEQAAKAVGSSGKSVSDAKALKRDAPDLAEKVNNGDMTLNAATTERKERKKAEQAKRDARIAELKDQGCTREEIGVAVGINPRNVDNALRAERRAREAEEEARPLDWNTIPGNQRDKLVRAKAAIRKELEKEFRTRLLAELDQHRAKLDADFAAHKAAYDAQNERFRAARDEERRRYQEGIEVYRAKGLITPEEYNVIRSCLHPDSRMSVTDEKLAEAFRLFNDSRIKTLLVKEKP